MARPVKKPPEQWRREILEAAKELFLSKGYEETAVTDIMERAGGAKGMFYRFFQTKEEVLHALGDRMFFENNPFEAVRGRSDLNGMQKIRQVLALDRADEEREKISAQAVPVLKDPRILAAAVEANRRVLTPLWFELIEEGRRDGSIRTAYAKELSELLPLVNFWLLPSVFPGDAEGIRHKCRFIAEVLSAMGLPIIGEGMYERTERILGSAPSADKAHFGEIHSMEEKQSIEEVHSLEEEQSMKKKHSIEGGCSLEETHPMEERRL